MSEKVRPEWYIRFYVASLNRFAFFYLEVLPGERHIVELVPPIATI